MDKRGKIWLWIILAVVVIILAISTIYLYNHSQEPQLKDSDGQNFYSKGFIYNRTLFGWEVVAGDGCFGNTVREYYIHDASSDPNPNTPIYITFKEFTCPNGCENGACI